MTDSRLEGTLNGSTHANGQASSHPLASKIESQAAALHREWATDPRWAGIERTYSAADVVQAARLGTRGANPRPAWRRAAVVAAAGGRLRQRPRRAHRQPGGAAGQGRAARRFTCLAGRSPRTPTWLARSTRTRASTRRTRCPAVVRRINNALLRADQITWAESQNEGAPYWLAPIVADAEAGFGGALNAFELMKAMIAAGAAGGALGGPACVREEVRPPGRQGTDPDRPAHQDAERRAACRRRLRRAEPHRGAHRRAGGDADHLRRR